MMTFGFSRIFSNACMFRRYSKQMISPSISPSPIQERIKRVENELLPAMALEGFPVPKSELLEKMQQYKIPAVSIAVINDGKIEWAKSYGKGSLDQEARITTLFQAGSISKPISAFGALALVQEGKLDLNADINEKLTSWRLEAPTKITLKQLLSHTSGINIMGFEGYETCKKIPNLKDILNGKEPANNPPIGLEFDPGTFVKYSSGGYTIVQQLIEDVVKRSFSSYMHDMVFKPLKMTNSTMQCPLPTEYLERIAIGHGENGLPINGGYRIYPEAAAAGLWSTPIDISKWVIDIQNSLINRSQNSILNQKIAELMLTRVLNAYGLGIVVNGTEDNVEISHKGRTDGFTCGFVAYPYLKKGVVVMMNSHNSGFCLVDDITRAVSEVYQWPFNKTKIKSKIELSLQDLEKFSGRYGIGNDSYDPIVSKINNELFIQYGRFSTPYKLHKDEENKFFSIETGDEYFFSEEVVEGGMAHMLKIVMQTGQEFKLKKIA